MHTLNAAMQSKIMNTDIHTGIIIAMVKTTIATTGIMQVQATANVFRNGRIQSDLYVQHTSGSSQELKYDYLVAGFSVYEIPDYA